MYEFGEDTNIKGSPFLHFQGHGCGVGGTVGEFTGLLQETLPASETVTSVTFQRC